VQGLKLSFRHSPAAGLLFAPLAEHRGGGFLNLLTRDVAQVLCKAPAVAEGIGDLTVALAPENVLEWLSDLRAGVDRAFPDRIDVLGVQVQDGGGAADAERREDAQLWPITQVATPITTRRAGSPRCRCC
jgi:hypothetical protein